MKISIINFGSFTCKLFYALIPVKMLVNDHSYRYYSMCNFLDCGVVNVLAIGKWYDVYLFVILRNSHLFGLKVISYLCND